MLAFVPPEFLLGLSTALEAVNTGFLILDRNGHPCFATPLLQPIASGDGVYREARAWVQALAAHLHHGDGLASSSAAPPSEARFGAAIYKGAAEPFHDGAIVVLSCVSTEGVADQALTEAFGLTPSEAEVARLLAQRRSNAEVAERLGISPHTARRHTERVLAKMGVGSRYEVEQTLSLLC